MANTYYVSAAGLDSNSGQSTLLPWLTVAKVNGSTFLPGDTVLFRRGDSWAETLTPPSSGTIGNPITFGAYGTGAAPLLNRVGGSVVVIPARSDLVIQDIDSTASGVAGAVNGTGIWTRITLQRMTLNVASGGSHIANNSFAVNTCLIDSITMGAGGGASNRIAFPAAGNSDIVISNLTSVAGGTTTQINIATCVNLTLTNVTVVGGSTGIALATITGALVMTTVSATGATTSGIKLTSCTAVLTASGLTIGGTNQGMWILTSALGVGSSLSSSTISLAGDGLRIDGSSGLTCTSVTAQNGTGRGFYMLGAWSTLVFNSCTSFNNLVDGFQFFGSGSAATLTDCVADSNKIDGFSMLNGSTVHDVTCIRCIAKNNGSKDNTANGDGFTSHDAIYNFLLIRCIAHGNTQSGFAMIATSHGWMYHCIAFNNGGDWFTQLGGLNLNSVRGGFYIPITGLNATTGTSWTVKNCIASSNYPVELMTHTALDYARMTLDYNEYYHPANSSMFSPDDNATFQSWTTYHTTNGFETHSIYGDPLFVSAGADFHLQAASPAINAGVAIPGVNDGYSGSAPDMGAIPAVIGRSQMSRMIPLLRTVRRGSAGG